MCAKKFLSTPSARRATIISSIIVLPLSISIHALREEGDIVHGIGESLSFISIHALREEGDALTPLSTSPGIYFYPRPPRGGRPFPNRWKISTHLFLSTPSARRATMVTVAAKSGLLIFLSTPSARRATACTTASTRPSTDFYPRPPRGGRRGRRSRRSPHREISIHALREEGDALRVSSNTASKYFYPRPPRGGRLASVALMVRHMGFLSTPSARRATHSVLRDPEHGAISIHALREEGDHRLRLQRLRLTISIHALREEGDPLPLRVFDYKEHFYPRPPRGGRPNNFATQAYPLNFYPRPPRGGRPDRCNAGMHACEFLSTPSARRATSGRRPAAQAPPNSIPALREAADPE